MPNTTLPTNVTAGTTGHAGFHSTVHAEVNRLSRDTGWCNATGLIVNGWTATSLLIRRVDYQVFLRVENLNGAASTDPTFLEFGNAEPALSVNFAAETSGTVRTAVYESPSAGFRMHLMVGQSLGIDAVFSEGNSTGGTRLEANWSTFRAWPSFLPPAA